MDEENKNLPNAEKEEIDIKEVTAVIQPDKTIKLVPNNVLK